MPCWLGPQRAAPEREALRIDRGHSGMAGWFPLGLTLTLGLCLGLISAQAQSQQSSTEGPEFNTTPISNGGELMALLQTISGRMSASISLPAGQVVNVSDAQPPKRPTGTMTGGILRMASSNASAPAILDLGWRALATVGVILAWPRQLCALATKHSTSGCLQLMIEEQNVG